MNKVDSRHTLNKILSIILLLGIAFTFVQIVYAVTPNPGHLFTESSGGIVTGDLIYGSAADTLSARASVAAGSYLRSAGVSTAPVWSTVTLPNSVTTGDLLYGSASNVYSNLADVAAGSYLRSGGAGVAPLWSTPTLPNTAANLKILIGNTTNWVESTPAYPNAAVTAGKVIVSDGTNYIASTPTFPNASATSRKKIVSDGTNWVASTETWAVPGTSGNVLTSDGTNWTSAAAAGGNDARVILDALTTGEQFDVTANSVALTEAVNLSQTLAAGTYTFKYKVIYRSNDATNGIRLAVNYTGTSGAFVWNWYTINTVSTASNAISDQNSVLTTGTLAGYYAARAKFTTTMGTTISADTVNADMLAIIEGVFVATGAGDLELWAGNEAAGAGDINSLMIGTSVEIHKTK
ncbi:MAG: hypothetical protein Q8R36_05680 [bacterium]|nr:hypothetical protein [bacterium]